MGEYAIRKSDNEEIKIGTCESMYYLRYEDQDKVKPCQGSGFGWFWRLPFPDEDNILPGEYEQYNRGYRLYKTVETPGTQPDYNEDFSTEDDLEPGTIQLRHECGLIVNTKCYHGETLPEGKDSDFKPNWNGKSWFFELKCLREADGKIHPVVHCRFCQGAWRFTWEEVLPYIHGKMKKRLEKYVF